jgi:hypothetical protein
VSALDTEMVGIDMLDAAELAEICEYVSCWIRQAPPAVTDSLVRYGASCDAPTILLEALEHFSDLLVRLVPSLTPTTVDLTAPLGAGEALGLAELLIELALRGWPSDADHAEALEHDCRRWALRLTHIPGVIPGIGEVDR